MNRKLTPHGALAIIGEVAMHMELSIRSIQSERGASIRAEFLQDVDQLDWDRLLVPHGPARVEVTATNLGGVIRVEGRLQLRVGLVCSRCAQEYAVDLDEPILEFFVKNNSPSARSRWADEVDDEPPGELPDDLEMDERRYSGDVLHLDEVLRENVLLAIPMKPVCRDDCRGLCPECGANLNDGDCGCGLVAVDPRWADLARWLETPSGKDPKLN